MALRFENIKTFAKGDLALTVPFEAWTADQLRVSVEIFGQEQYLSEGPDYTVSGDTVNVSALFAEYAVTIAAVPCPSLVMPKFGTASNEDIQAAYADLASYVAYLERRVDGSIRAPSCPSDEKRVLAFVDGALTWADPADCFAQISITTPEVVEEVQSPVVIRPKNSLWEFCKPDCYMCAADLSSERALAAWPADAAVGKYRPAEVTRKLRRAIIFGFDVADKPWEEDCITVPTDEKFIYRAKLEIAA